MTTEPTHLDIDDGRFAAAARAILLRHANFEAEANITSAVRDFLTLTALAESDAIVEENPPSDGSRQAVDLTALDTFIEFKRRIGTAGAAEPNPEYVAQLDGYLEQSQADGKGVRMGVLTDGRHWLLRWPGAGPARAVPPYYFTLETAEQWLLLYEWLRDNALFALERLPASRANIERYLGPDCAASQRDLQALADLYAGAAHSETVRVKRRLWQDLLTAALGEIAHTAVELDDLFIRHTYLSLAVGLAVQASFGIDIRQVAETDPDDLLQGRRFSDATGLTGVIAADFFAWPGEVSGGGAALLRAMARRLARFDWPGEHGAGPPSNIAAILYETVIPPEERRTLGEYYTPDWLAQTMVQEIITDPLHQRALDPSCGSGTFIAAAVAHFLEAAARSDAGVRLEPIALLARLREAVIGIDVHPAAVHLARAAWALAARPAVAAAKAAGYDASGTVPVYLGDALQLRFRAGDLFAEHQVTTQTDDAANTELAFPMSLVDRAETFDALLNQAVADIEAGDDPLLALDDHGIAKPAERQMLTDTFAALQRLHAVGHNHIWAYYTRNLVRPVVLSRAKVDVVIGNPPWLNYNRTIAILRTELEQQSKNLYRIWVGGRYASNQDVAGLFYARCVDLYLRDGGVIGMVMPHSALQSGQYARWRTGEWTARSVGRGQGRNGNGAAGRTLAVNFGYKTAWDLEPLEPNTFFPVASCVVFAERIGENAGGAPLAGIAEQWQGTAGADNVRRVGRGLTDTSVSGDSPYDGYAHQGASMRPRRLFLVQETVNTAIIQAALTVTVNPRRGAHDKAPWRTLDLTAITEQTIESRHLYDIHMGETVVPYATLAPLQALLPMRRGEYRIPTDDNGPGGIRLGGLDYRMRRRWQIINRLWEAHKRPANKLNLLARLDYYGKLSSQLAWQQDNGGRPVRLVYTAGGQPTAAVVYDDAALIDETLYRVTCRDLDEANYLLAIINSDALADAVNPLTVPNWSGRTRNLHKHLWKLPIPEYDAANPQHREIAEAGRAAALAAQARLSELRAARGPRLTVTIARRELRAWLRSGPEGARVEGVVGELLAAE